MTITRSPQEVQAAPAAPNTWTLVDWMSASRQDLTATLMNNGQVLVAGGDPSSTTAELYDPATDLWTYTDSLSQGRYRHAAVLLTDGRVMVIGGYRTGDGDLASTEIYDPETGTWSDADNLNAARQSPTATLLPDGRVLAVGGYGSGGTLTSAELYDPNTDTWTTTDSVAESRYLHTATLLPDGRVLVVGGRGATWADSLDSAELYDPATETWTSATGTLATARMYHTATLLADGRVLVVGGNDGSSYLATAELYDPVTDAWTTAAGTLTQARERHTSTLLPDGKVLVAGGYAGGPMNSVNLFDPAAGTFAATDSLNHSRYIHTTTLLPDGRVLAMGGRSGGTLLSTEVYDYAPITPTWTVDTAMPTDRSDFAATLLADGRVLVAGGSWGATRRVEAELYDPATAAWTSADNMNVGRSDLTLTLLADGRVLAVGGYNSGYLSSAELYDPDTDTWSTTGSMSVGRIRHTATLLPDGRVLVTGGYNGTYLSSAEIYNPVTGTWDAAGSIGASRDSHTATLLPNGQVLVAGGDGGYYVSSARLYDPVTDNWTSADFLNTGRLQHTATLLPNGQVLIAGGIGSTGQLNSVELYDPTTDTFTTVSAMNVAHTQHPAILLPDGRVMIAGGRTSGGNPTQITERYDPTTDTWDVVDGMGVFRAKHVAALLLDGRVFVAGGWTGSGYTASIELYDPMLTYQTWQLVDNLATARHNHAATLLEDGRVLVAGGLNAGWSATTGAELYLPASGTFSTTGSLSVGRQLHTATRLDDGRVLVAGGLGVSANPLASGELYNPATAAFLPTAGNMGQARSDHTASLLPDGRVLVAGGYNSGYLASAELYLPASGTFSGTDSLNTARDGHTATPLLDGSILVAGGFNGGGYVSQSERYDPVTETFTDTAGNLITGRVDHTATLLPDGRVLVAGGSGSGSLALSSAELYDPATETWSAAGSLNAGRYYHAAALLPSGRVLVTGGSDAGGTPLDSAEIYDPATDSWTTIDDLRDVRMNHTATTLANGRVLVAGGVDSSSITGAELYVEGRPLLDGATSPLMLGESLTANGATFRQRSEASGGDTRNSATNVPLVQLMRLDNSQTRWLPVDPTTPFSDTAFTSLPVEDWPQGYARATVFVNGIPSIARTVQVLDYPGYVTSVAPPANSHTASVTTSLTITVEGSIAPQSITTQTLAVHGGFQGRMDGTYSVGSIVFNPGADFYPGELVQTTVTTGVIANGQPLSDTFVWQFRTAVVASSGHFTDSGQTISASDNTFDVELGDLDGDGDLDAVTANGGGQSNRRWLNSGMGVFTYDGSLGTGDSRGAALGDLDGDGDLDIYFANNGGADQVWINQGGAQGGVLGSFVAGQSVGSLDTYGVELGDLDGDGDLDALTANYAQSSRVWLNDGTGTFTAGQDLPSANTYSVALGDLDGDGDLDAVEANYNNPQAIYLNDGSGSFSAHPSPPPINDNDSTRDVELGDLDGDGDLDLLVVENRNWTGTNYNDSIWLNDGSGAFSLHQWLELAYGEGGALGDLDGDGDLDAWVVNFYPWNLDLSLDTVWLNDGSGTMTKIQSTDNRVGNSVTLGDLDGDGDLDAFVGNGVHTGSGIYHPSAVWFNLKQGQVTDVAPTPNTHSAPITTSVVITTDVDVNAGSVNTETVMVHGGLHGHMDGVSSFGSLVFDPAEDLHPGELVRTTVTTDVTANGLPLVGPYVWQFRTAVEVGSGWFVDSGQAVGDNNARTVELGDLDGDGDLDAFVSNYTQPDTAWLNDGNGTYHQVWTDTVSSNSWPFGMTLGDLDGDGDLDVYEAAMWSNDRVLMNNGDGTFSHGQSIGSSDGRGAELADLDGDGDLDAFVATASNGNPPNRVYLNDGTGTLVGGQSMNSGRTFGLALGDLDNDGDLDAFFANFSNYIPDQPDEGPNKVWLNNGDGTFTDSGQSLGLAESWSVALGDLDGDGDLDAFVANEDNEPNTVWFNDGTGTFSDSGQTLGAERSRQVKLGDVDGDGDLDAFVANNDTPNQIWLNDGSGTFSLSAQEISSNGQGLSLGDVDGDGDLDAFIARSGADQVWFNQNVADLSISKTVSPPVIAPGQTVTYTLVYTNSGPEIAAGVVITDFVPLTLTNVHYDATPPITPIGAVSYTWDVGTLGVGEGGIITVTGTVSTGVTGIFSLTNEAVITSALVCDEDLIDNTAAVTNTVDADPPAPPVLASPADSTVLTDTTPTLVWQPSASAAGYLLDLDGSAMDLGNVTTHTTTVLADGVYTWTVAAYDDLGNTSVYTDVWSFEVDTTPPASPALTSPGDGAVLTDTTPMLTWQPSASAAGYLLDLDGSVMDLGDITAYTTTVLANKVYTWTVAAYDDLGNTSAYTDVWSFEVDTTPPASPALISPANGAVLTDTTPTLVWQPSAGAAGYLLDLDGSAMDLGDVTAYTTTVLADGVYTWTVAAYDYLGNTSAYTDVWSFTVDTVTPEVVGTWPPHAAVDVDINAPIIITFTKPVNTTTFDFGVLPPDPGGWTPAWNGTSTVVTLTHNGFDYWQDVTARIVFAEDQVGNQMPGLPYDWEFAVQPYRVQLPLLMQNW